MTYFIEELWRIYNKVKEETNKKMSKNIAIIKSYIFQNQTQKIKLIQGSNNVDMLYVLHGYLTLRLLELIKIEDLIKIDYKIIESFSDKYNKAMLVIKEIEESCFEELLIIQLIRAVKEKEILINLNKEKNKIKINPPNKTKEIQKAISNLLAEENQYWNFIFSPFNFYKEEIYFNTSDFGSSIASISINDLKEDWNFFKMCWEENFGKEFVMDKNRFLQIYTYFKTKSYPLPFSSSDSSDFKKEMGLSLDETYSDIFDLLEIVLPKINNLNLPGSINEISHLTFNQFLEIGIGWKAHIKETNNLYYHISGPNSLNHFLNKGFSYYFKRKNLPGPYYEKELVYRINLINDGLITLESSNDFIIGLPEIQEKPVKRVKRLEMKIITNLQIEIPEVKKFGINQKKGEIDLLLHSNRNLFIIEAKSFFGGRSNFQKASEQCMKYLNWLKKPETKKILKQKGIDKWNRVFILILTNRQERRLYVQCNKSKNYFPIISFPILISLLLGRYTLQLSENQVIHQAIYNSFEEIIQKHFQELKLEDFDKEYSEKFRKIWYKYMFIILNAIEIPPDYDFQAQLSTTFPLGFVLLEHKIQNGEWELKKEIHIITYKNYQAFLVTEIANTRHSFFCRNCKKVWIYYWPFYEPKFDPNEFKELRIDESKMGKIGRTLKSGKCHKCGKSLVKKTSKIEEELRNKIFDAILSIKMEKITDEIR